MEKTSKCLVLHCINLSLCYIAKLLNISISTNKINNYLLMQQELRRYKYKAAKQELDDLEYVCLYSLMQQANEEYQKRRILM